MLRNLQLEEGQRVSLAEPEPEVLDCPEETWERAQENKQYAAKIKCLRTLAALSTSEREHSYYMDLVT